MNSQTTLPPRDNSAIHPYLLSQIIKSSYLSQNTNNMLHDLPLWLNSSMSSSISLNVDTRVALLTLAKPSNIVLLHEIDMDDLLQVEIVEDYVSKYVLKLYIYMGTGFVFDKETVMKQLCVSPTNTNIHVYPAQNATFKKTTHILKNRDMSRDAAPESHVHDIHEKLKYSVVLELKCTLLLDDIMRM